MIYLPERYDATRPSAGRDVVRAASKWRERSYEVTAAGLPASAADMLSAGQATGDQELQQLHVATPAVISVSQAAEARAAFAVIADDACNSETKSFC
jgi:hypothetical protein